MTEEAAGYSANVDDSGAVTLDPETQGTEEQDPTQNVEQTEENQEPTVASEEGTQEGEKPKGGGVQKRIDELVAQRYEAESKARQAHQENEAMRQHMAQMQGQSQHQQLLAQKPVFENYETTEQYEQAVGQWTQAGYQMQAQAQAQAQHNAQVQQAQAQKQASVAQKVVEAAAKYPDFQQVVQNQNVPPLVQINQAAYEALSESDNMADVAYYLAKNPAELYSFQSLSPTQAVRKIAQLEMKTKAGFNGSGVTAPRPPSTVSGKTKVETDPDKMSDADYERAWRAGKT